VAAGRRRPAQGEGSRHEAREQAMALLYEAELKSLEPAMLLEALPATPDPFAVKLVKGVAGRRAQVDSLVAGTAVGWEIGRMPIVDRTILRLATYELLDQPGTPVAVVIDEAVELAKEYSTDASGAFVNGVLSHIARQLHR
jgi:N utilization substance protein B